MTVFLDTNIILDVLLKNPHFEECENVFALKDDNDIDFFISAASATDIFYVLNKNLNDREKAKSCLVDLLNIVYIAGIDEVCVRNALDSSWPDFEDSVQHEAACQIRADFIVTRNLKDFSASFIKVISPNDFIKMFP